MPGVPTHVVQRGNNRQPVFFDDADILAYLNWLKQSAARYDCTIHAYVLMTNHVHLLLTPMGTESVSRMMQYVGRRFVPYINHRHGRSGTLWEGRFKSSLVESEAYLLACMRYIELNPVRAALVAAPADYRWSSHRANAGGDDDALLTPHETYRALGGNRAERTGAYRALFADAAGDVERLAAIRSAWQTGTPLGSDRFRKEVERRLEIKVGYARPGRPRSSGLADSDKKPAYTKKRGSDPL